VSSLGVIVGGSQYVDGSGTRRSFSLDLLDLDAERLRTIELPFLPHGFSIMPGKETVAALFEKRGPNACLVELTTGRVRPIAPGEGRAFYGHGVFAPDARQLFGVEIDTRTHAGLLTVRDTRTWEVVEEVPTGGQNPHDALLLDDRTTLVVTNGGGDAASGDAPSVTFLDLPSRRLLERVPIADERLNAGHVAVARDGSVAVVSAPREGLPDATALGGLSLGARGGAAARMEQPRDVTARMVGESLSVAIHEPSRVVAATHPYGDLLTLWHLDDRRLLRALDLPSARGVALTLCGRYLAVSHGKDGSLSLLDPGALALVPGSTRALGRFTGSHVFSWRLPEGAAFGS
jgi:hypothetical protein